MTTTYPMTVTFQKNNPEETILAGMWWSAKIILNKTENVLIVPSQAITTISGQNMVMLKQWQNWIENPVEIWESDGINTEITSWLKIWDTVKSMFYSNEWMTSMWLSMSSQEVDLESMRQNAMRNNARQNMGGYWWWMWGSRGGSSWFPWWR